MPSHYLTPTATHRRLGLVCLGTGAQEGQVRPVRDRVLASYAAVLITSGSGSLRSGADPSDFAIEAPAVFFLVPGIRHSYAASENGWRERWVLFEGPATEAYVELGYLPRESPVLPLADPLPARRLFDRLLRACRPERPGAEVESAALVHQLLLTLSRCRIARHGGRTHETVLSELRSRACSPASVTEHARRLGLSVTGLRTAVRRGAGCNPKEFLLRARLNEAKLLLAEARVPITQVARMVGYEDPAYFSRIFTRRVGSTPREFRRQQARVSESAG